MDLLSPQLAEQIFNECDIRKTGALTLEDFRSLSQFTDADPDFIFEQLDLNKDGLVTKEEFVNGFARALNLDEKGFSEIRRQSLAVLSRTASSAASPNNESVSEEPEVNGANGLYEMEAEAGRLDIPCQEEVLALYERLQSLTKPERLKPDSVPALLSQFEKIIDGVHKELSEQRRQNERLQTLYEKEKIRHDQQIDEVESNLTMTLAEAKEKAKREERDRLEREKEQMCQQFETELAEMKSTIATLQKSVLDETNVKYHKSEELRQKVQDLSKENMRLKYNLAEKQTELVLIQANMAKLRQNFDDKSSDWSTEKEHLVQLTENMNNQLQLLYDANKQLHDTNDNLRSALETRQAYSRQLNLRTPSPVGSGRASPLASSRLGSWTPCHTYDNDRSPTRPGMLTVRRQDAIWRRMEDSDEEIDSGIITHSSNTTSGSATDEDLQRRMAYGQAWNGHTGRDDTMTPSDGVLPATGPLGYTMVRSDSFSSSGTRSSRTYSTRVNGTVYQPIEPTGPPERSFRVVMVGDAAVGKSSLVERLVKGEFQEYTASTIGVACHNKVMRVDDRNVALQVWDTAGQERFRSVCKSYFRRADGAILAYDCTCEQSFLNVRYWLDAVQENANRKVPVLLCANKVDLRIAAAAQGRRCVSREDGENLAKTHNTTFIETSAKEGTNVIEAALHLTREMLAAEDFEVQSTTIVTLEQKKKKTNCTSCKNS